MRDILVPSREIFIPTRNIWVPRRSLRDNRGFISPALIGAIAGRRTAAPSYILSDNLEYASGAAAATAGWVDGGTPSWAYATAPAPLQGSYSFASNNTSNFSTYTLSAAQADFNFYCLWQAPASIANNPYILRVLDGSGNLMGRVRVLAAGQVRITDSGGTALATSPAGTVTSGVTYSIWIRFVKGTGANGTCDVFVSATPTKPGSTTVATTGGDWAADTGRIRLTTVSTDLCIWDYIRVSSSVIGSAPA